MRTSLATACVVLFAALPVMAASPATIATAGNPTIAAPSDWSAPIDYGYGPGVVRPGRRLARTVAKARSMAAPSVPVGNATAGTVGFYGPALPWPIIAISATLTPNGQVMNFGTDGTGKPGGSLLVYDVWDPARGLGADAHMVLPNMTATEILCAGVSLMLGTGQALVVGGDLTIDGTRNFSNNHTEFYDPATRALTPAAPMQYARWYPSIVSMHSGEKLVLGGRIDPSTPASTPEIYNPTTGWRALTGAASDQAFAYTHHNWYYPRGFVTNGNRVFILAPDGTMWLLDPRSQGTLTKYTAKTLTAGTNDLPTVMFSPGRILAVRDNAAAVVVGIKGSAPVVTPTGSLSQHRSWSNATVLADGKVVVTGGSAEDNTLTGVAYQNETWDPATGRWTPGAIATKPRLYHSTALLLPDGSVLTAGGGAPGPVAGLNAEIYYPPYLYLKDGSGRPAARPTIMSTPKEVTLGASFQASVGPADRIGKVNLVRLGSVTHSANFDQSFVQLPFTQSGAALQFALPADPTAIPPGYYMMFAFNRAGVPSVAAILRIAGA